MKVTCKCKYGYGYGYGHRNVLVLVKIIKQIFLNCVVSRIIAGG